MLPSPLKFWTCGKPSLGSSDMVPQTEAAGAFWSAGGHFSDQDSGRTEENLDNPRVPCRV